jgi:uncharacterized lipoprotein YddW (UPF0748 family)
MAFSESRTLRNVRRTGIPIRVAFAVLIVAAVHAVVSAAAGTSMRAFWIPSSAMSSAASIQRTVASAVSGGFDAVIAPIAIGDGTDADPFDGGAELVREARERGLGAFLSVSVNVAAPVGELPASRDHVIYQHPEWLMVPREIASEMLKVDARSPGYLGRIARWTRANPDRVGGVYVSPLDPAAVSYVASTVTAAVARYAADGFYLEAVDFPGEDFDYSRHAMDLFRTRLRAAMSSAERSRLDEIESIDPFAYAEEFPEQWRQFRESALTDLLGRLRSALTAGNPAITIMADARANADQALKEHFQAWRSWLDRGLVARVGYRSRSSSTVFLSSDGALAFGPQRLSSVQTTGSGGSR